MAGYQPTNHTISTRIVIFSWTVCALGALFYCYEYFLRISPSVMTSQLMKTYNLNGAGVGNLSAFYYHSYVPMQLVVGALIDRFAPRRLLAGACLLCAFGTYLFTNQCLSIAELGRFLMGIGSAFAFVGALKLATIWLPPQRFALVSGIICGAGMIGAVIGDILLHKMVLALGWQMTLYAFAAIGVLLTLVMWCVIRDENPYQEDFHIHIVKTAELLRGFARVVGNLQFWLNGIVGLLMYLSLSAFAELWGIPYLIQTHQLSKTHAVIANSLVFFGWAVGSPFWGWFSDYLQLRKAPMLYASMVTLVLMVILFYVNALSLPAIYFLLFSIGLLSSSEILVFSVCREISHIKMTGTAVSLTNALVMLGGSLLQPLIGKLLDLRWSGGLVDGARVYSSETYQIALSVLPISLVITLVLMLFIKETHCKIRTDF